MPSLTKVQTGFLDPQGAFTLDPGTASAPGLKFSDSSATGMFSPSTGVLGFSTGSTQNALSILANGNVGIGTTNPSCKLHTQIETTAFANGDTVNSYRIARFLNLSSDGASRGIEFGAPTGSVGSPVYLKVVSTGARFSFVNQSDVENVTILDSGNVGIGTTNPSTKLAVSGTITESTNGTNYWPVVTQQDIGTAPNQVPINGYLGSLAFEDADSVSIGLLNVTGNVGIGTTSAYAKTHIEINSAGGAGSGSAAAIWLKNANQTNNNSATIFAGNSSSQAASAINFIHNNYTTNAGSISFDTRYDTSYYIERLRITYEGSIGIGAYPYSYNSKLEIRTEDYLPGSYFYGHGGTFFCKPFTRGDDNITVDILTLSNFSQYCGIAIYLEIIASSATTTQGCLIDGFAYLQTSNAGSSFNSTPTPTLTIRNQWSTGIGVGSLSWSGTTLRYTTVSPSYTKYQMRVYVTAHDTALITMAR